MTRLFRLTFAALSIGATIAASAQTPGGDTYAPSQGYFPTLSEEALLRGPDDSRSLGGGLDNEDGPDQRRQTATDLFPYEDSSPNFYQRNQGVFKPLDHVLGVGTRFDAVTYEFDGQDNTSLTFDANTGFLTRNFAPELAMVKAGPLYLDVLWLGTGIVWSDYNGPQNQITANGQKDSGDGATGYVEVGLRGLLRFTDTIYLSVVGNIIYLPWENELALQFGSGTDVGFLTRFNYSETFGAWDVLIYNEFQGRPGVNWFGQATRDGLDTAGRYNFGFQNSGRTNQFYDRSFVFFTNRVGINATRLVFDNQWRFGTEYSHMDAWQTYRFQNHNKRDQLGLWLGYEGSIIPFAPRLSYDLTSYDGFQSLWHQFYLQVTGRLTENLVWTGGVGTAFTTGTTARTATPLLWEVRLDHTLTRNTAHYLMAGERIYDSEFNSQGLLTRFIGYGIDQRLGRRVQATAFVQYADSEQSLTTGENNERMIAGLTLRYNPLDFTSIIATVLYERSDPSRPAGDSDRWLYRLEASQQLGLRLTGSLFYQYEDFETTPGAFTEHALGLSLRRYF